MELDNHKSDNSNPDANRPVYTLGIASQLSDIPAHSIRQYIDRGLLIPFKLSSKRHLFSQNDINRLKHIHLLIHEKGLNFAGIRRLLAQIPCWALRPCRPEDHARCGMRFETRVPCWIAPEKLCVEKLKECYHCPTYRRARDLVDLKVHADIIPKEAGDR